MRSPFTLHTSTVLIALSLVVVPLAGAAAQKGGAAPRAAPSTPRSVIVPRLPEYYDPAGKQNTAPTHRERILKRISLLRRLRRSDAELQRVIAQLDQIVRKLSPAGMGRQQKAQLDARRNRIRAWRNSLSRLSVKLSRIYVGPAWPSRNELNATIRAVEHARESARNQNGMMTMKLHPLYQNYNQAMSTLSSIMKSQHDTLKAIIAN